jgi:hypothetical protein
VELPRFATKTTLWNRDRTYAFVRKIRTGKSSTTRFSPSEPFDILPLILSVWFRDLQSVAGQMPLADSR